eukprot:2661024-Pleurochrysis_carterae.AAC.6
MSCNAALTESGGDFNHALWRDFLGSGCGALRCICRSVSSPGCAFTAHRLTSGEVDVALKGSEAAQGEVARRS